MSLLVLELYSGSCWLWNVRKRLVPTVRYPMGSALERSGGCQERSRAVFPPVSSFRPSCQVCSLRYASAVVNPYTVHFGTLPVPLMLPGQPNGYSRPAPSSPHRHTAAAVTPDSPIAAQKSLESVSNTSLNGIIRSGLLFSLSGCVVGCHIVLYAASQRCFVESKRCGVNHASPSSTAHSGILSTRNLRRQDRCGDSFVCVSSC